MKHLRLLALAIAVIFFAASCSKDKDNKPVENTSINGRWDVSTILTVEPNADPYTYTGKDGDFIEFNDNGTMASSVDGFEQELSYEMVDASHVKVDGYVAEIKEHTSNKLVILDPPHEGQPETFTYTLTK